MSLPVIRTIGEERWDCVSCAACCRGTIIPLRAEELARLHEQKWEEDPDYRGQTLFVKSSWGSNRHQLAQRADGSCVFLTAENRCRIHEKFGADAKPLPCRMFPLQLIPHEKQTILTLRRSCPTAAADEGRPLNEHLPGALQFVKDGLLNPPEFHPPAMQTGGPRFSQDSPKNASRVLASVARILGDERYPPVRRVVHAVLFARFLERAKLGQFSSKQVADLAEVLEAGVCDEATPLFTQRERPSNLGLLLFRLTLPEFVRLHPDYRPLTGWGVRFRLFTVMLRMFRGVGNLPALHPNFPTATFAQLEAPLASLDPAYLSSDVQRPLERYLATVAASHQFALANRSDWSLVQSIRGLALTFPIGLAMLRWGTMGRTPSSRDMALIVSALDRAQGYAPLVSGRYRSTLGLLEYQGDLERLAVWFAR